MSQGGAILRDVCADRLNGESSRLHCNFRVTAEPRAATAVVMRETTRRFIGLRNTTLPGGVRRQLLPSYWRRFRFVVTRRRRRRRFD